MQQLIRRIKMKDRAFIINQPEDQTDFDAMCLPNMNQYTAQYILDQAQLITNTPSLVAKCRILQREIKVNPQFAEILYYALSEDFTTYIGDTFYVQMQKLVAAEFMLNGEGSINLIEGFANFKKLHECLVRKTITGDQRVSAVKNLLARCDRATADLFLRLFAQKLFKNIAAATVNAAIGYEVIPVWGVQLCKTYDPIKHYAGIDTWYATPKINGFRATYKNGQLFSRTGKSWSGPGFDEIMIECERICTEGGFNLLDGELCTPMGVEAPISFQNLSSLLRNSSRGKDRQASGVQLNIFAAINTKQTNFGVATTYNMYNRLSEMQNTLGNELAYVKFLDAVCLRNNCKEIFAQCVKYVKEGYEGIILRDPKIVYALKRTNHLLKYKFFHEIDLEIVGIVEGTGRLVDSMGALELRGTITLSNGLKVTVMTSCGTGFSDELRRKFWEEQDEMMGRTVVVKYQDISDISNWNECSLIFPVFLQLR